MARSSKVKSADAMMTVRMKTAMAGENFSYRRGQLVSAPIEHAQDWIARGMAEDAPTDEVMRAEVEGLRFTVKKQEAEIAELNKTVEDLRAQLAGKKPAKAKGKAKDADENKPAGDDAAGETEQPGADDPSASLLN